MSYSGILAERRIWSGTPGIELSLAAIMLEDGSTEIETRVIGHGDGRPVVDWRRRIPLPTAFWLAEAIQDVLIEGARRIENDGDRDDREEHIFAEARAAGVDGEWVRIVASGHFGKPRLRVEWGIGEESDLVFWLPFMRARELPSALLGVFFVAFDAQIPEPDRRGRQSRSNGRCPSCGSPIVQDTAGGTDGHPDTN